jgi:hypothetical protein
MRNRELLHIRFAAGNSSLIGALSTVICVPLVLTLLRKSKLYAPADRTVRDDEASIR